MREKAGSGACAWWLMFVTFVTPPMFGDVTTIAPPRALHVTARGVTDVTDEGAVEEEASHASAIWGWHGMRAQA